MTRIIRVVMLERLEVMWASQLGVARAMSCRRKGYKHKYGFFGDGFGVQIEGAGGEFALAKALGCYFVPTLDTFKTVPDVGQLEVRTRSRHKNDLLIHPDEDPERIYVHVTGELPTYRVWGWIQGKEQMIERWLQVPQLKSKREMSKADKDRPPAYFIPAQYLHPMNTLREDYFDTSTYEPMEVFLKDPTEEEEECQTNQQ